MFSCGGGASSGDKNQFGGQPSTSEASKAEKQNNIRTRDILFHSGDVRNRLKLQDKTIREQGKTIQEKDKIIQEKDEDIKLKDKTIQDLAKCVVEIEEKLKNAYKVVSNHDDSDIVRKRFNQFDKEDKGKFIKKIFELIKTNTEISRCKSAISFLEKSGLEEAAPGIIEMLQNKVVDDPALQIRMTLAVVTLAKKEHALTYATAFREMLSKEDIPRPVRQVMAEASNALEVEGRKK